MGTWRSSLFHPLSSPLRLPASSSPLTSMLSAITSSLESFIRSLGRCAHLLLPAPPTPHLAVYLGPQTSARKSTCLGTQFPRSSGAASSSFQTSLGVSGGWGAGAAQGLQLKTSSLCVSPDL